MFICIKRFLLLSLIVLFIVKLIMITTVINKSSCTLSEEVQYLTNNYPDDNEASTLLFETKRVEDNAVEHFTFLFSILKCILLCMLCFNLTTFKNIFVEDHRIKLAQLIPRRFHGGKFRNAFFAL